MDSLGSVPGAQPDRTGPEGPRSLPAGAGAVTRVNPDAAPGMEAARARSMSVGGGPGGAIEPGRVTADPAGAAARVQAFTTRVTRLQFLTASQPTARPENGQIAPRGYYQPGHVVHGTEPPLVYVRGMDAGIEPKFVAKLQADPALLQQTGPVRDQAIAILEEQGHQNAEQVLDALLAREDQTHLVRALLDEIIETAPTEGPLAEALDDYTSEWIVKCDYPNPSKKRFRNPLKNNPKDRVAVPADHARRSKGRWKGFKMWALKREKISDVNKDVRMEHLSTQTLNELGVRMPETRIISSNYNDEQGETKLMLACKLVKTPDTEEEKTISGFQTFETLKVKEDGESGKFEQMVGGRLRQNMVRYKDADGVVRYAEFQPKEMALVAVTTKLLADRDKVKAGNHGFEIGERDGVPFVRYTGIDPGKALPEEGGSHDLMSQLHLQSNGTFTDPDLSFIQEQQGAYKNFSMFDDLTMAERMEGFRQVHENWQSALDRFDEALNDPALTAGERERIESARNRLAHRLQQIVIVVGGHMKLEAEELDLLDNLEKATSPTTNSGEAGLFRHLHVTPETRNEWKMEKDGEGNYTLKYAGPAEGKRAAANRLRAFFNAQFDPDGDNEHFEALFEVREGIESAARGDSSLEFTLSADEFAAMTALMTENKVAQHKGQPIVQNTPEDMTALDNLNVLTATLSSQVVTIGGHRYPKDPSDTKWLVHRTDDGQVKVSYVNRDKVACREVEKQMAGLTAQIDRERDAGYEDLPLMQEPSRIRNEEGVNRIQYTFESEEEYAKFCAALDRDASIGDPLHFDRNKKRVRLPGFEKYGVPPLKVKLPTDFGSGKPIPQKWVPMEVGRQKVYVQTDDLVKHVGLTKDEIRAYAEDVDVESGETVEDPTAVTNAVTERLSRISEGIKASAPDLRKDSLSDKTIMKMVRTIEAKKQEIQANHGAVQRSLQIKTGRFRHRAVLFQKSAVAEGGEAYKTSVKATVFTRKIIGRGAFKKIMKGVGVGSERRLVAVTRGNRRAVPEREQARLGRYRGLPGIIQTHTVGVRGTGETSDVVVVQELAEMDLAAAIEQGKLSREDKARIMKEALTGLVSMHETAGDLHLDIKPANILLVRGDDGLLHAKLTDFGGATANKPNAKVRISTPAYRRSTDRHGSVGMDLHAMGLTFYRLLHGTPCEVETANRTNQPVDWETISIEQGEEGSLERFVYNLIRYPEGSTTSAQLGWLQPLG